MKRLLPWFLALAACGSPAHAPSKPAPTPTPVAVDAALDAVVTRTLAGRPVPGVSVAVFRGGQPVLVKGYGTADVAARSPVGPDTTFRIGSITKSFTAAAIVRLAAAGKLAVTDPVTKYLPDYDTKGKTITLYHLLTHTSGIVGYTELDEFWKRQNEAFPRSELVAMFAAPPLKFEPGEKWEYSNSGYYLLGLVIEKVTGQSYADAVRALVIEPAGLAHTGYCPNEMTAPAEARGYMMHDDQVVPSEPLDMAHPYAAGSLCSTAADLAHWLAYLASEPALWQPMTAPARLNGGKTHPYGFGLGVHEIEGHKSVGHGGGINGFRSLMTLFPDDGLAIVVLANFEGSAPGDLTEVLTRAAFGIPEPVFADLPLTDADAAPYPGTYAFPDIGLKVGVRWQDGKLESANLDDKGQPAGIWVRMQWQGGTDFVVPQAKAKLSFTVENGRATAVLVRQGGGEISGTRVTE